MILSPISYTPHEYKLLKIKPDSRLTNTSYEGLLNIIHSVYTPITNRLREAKYKQIRHNGVLSINTVNSITYEILFEGDNIKHTPIFYFGIPIIYSNYLKQRIQTTFPDSTLTFEDDIKIKLINMQFNNCYTYEYHYTKNNILSISTKETNFFESLLSIKKDIKKNECILFQIEMTPIGNSWKSFNEEKWDSIRTGKYVNVINKLSMFDKIIDFTCDATYQLLDFIDMILEIPTEKKIEKLPKINIQDFSITSRQKNKYDGFNVSIKLYVVGCEKIKADSYAILVDTAFKELEEDNRLIHKYNKKIHNIQRGKFTLPNKMNLMNTKELCSLVNIPNQKLQKKFKIDNINMKINNIPEELINSNYIRIGTDVFHGETRTICLPKTKRNRCLSRVYLSSMGAGKSNILLNNIVDSINYNNGVFIIDHINICELTKGIVDIFGDKVIVKNPKTDATFNFSFPELAITDNMSIEDRLDISNDVAYEIQYLINSIAINTETLSEIMTNYLFSACKIVFCHYGKTLQDFINVLLNQKIRHDFIDLGISQKLFTEDSYEIQLLLKLDKDDKPIKGLIDRISVLQRDTLFSKLLKRPYNDNDNFIKYFDNCIPVSIVMSNEDFPNKKKKDILSTFLLSKVRLAMMKRKNRDMITDIYIDEPQSLKNTMTIINDSIYESRKYGMSYVLAIQGINQLGILKDGLFDSGCHWFLLKGCNEKTFNELKFKLNNNFNYDDMVEMNLWHSLNIVSIDNKTHCFITKYPTPLKNKDGKLYIGE